MRLDNNYTEMDNETPDIYCILHNRCSSLGVTNMWMSILDNVLMVLFDGGVGVI